ncbi:hypothetical protein CAL7102_10327 [Dulcicalothrix desertica PCC 7102]|nr:hypothetical protein CAL7102_10327 [Dulcicalothrix desertica PCC 7102]
MVMLNILVQHDVNMSTIYDFDLVLFKRTFAIRQRFITVGGFGIL